MAASLAPAIIWFRDDLRLADNPALHAATATGRPLICLYIFEEEGVSQRPLGGAARWWLHGALSALHASLDAFGGELVLMRGVAADVIETIISETKAGAVYWNRRYDEASRHVDGHIKTTLKHRDIQVETFNGHLLREPWTVLTKSGTPFRLFTAYWRKVLQSGVPAMPLAKPKMLQFHKLPRSLMARSLDLGDLALEPKSPDWAGGLRAAWKTDESAAHACLREFLKTDLHDYAEGRDRPHETATSRLSPYLRFGNISPRQIWHTASAAVISGKVQASQHQLDKFLTELGWREFCYHLLYHLPDLARYNVRPQFDAMSWRNDKRSLRAWQRGLTGYPLVDAGMRELWTTGWMHNRVRMITASFLIKHLLIDWRDGEAWFWDTLVDADLANNPANWQWVAGSGADAAPYFRIFNPTLQGEKFDTKGDYIKCWVPELARLPASLVHRPWAAKADELDAAGIRLGQTYPHPIVDHDDARRRALDAWKEISGSEPTSED
jgi:deoxyribodipyrimidine photo-lyase